MVTVIIGGSRLALQDVSEGWITEQIARRRNDGHNACVRIEIQNSRANMTLATPGCGGRGGSRQPTSTETRIFEMWDHFKLNTHTFLPRNLIAFLKRMVDYL